MCYSVCHLSFMYTERYFGDQDNGFRVLNEIDIVYQKKSYVLIISDGPMPRFPPSASYLTGKVSGKGLGLSIDILVPKILTSDVLVCCTIRLLLIF